MEKKTMGSFLSALRKANGMTQQDVADRLGVTNRAVSRWERDEALPDITLIPALAEMFGVTCDELLRGERASEEAANEAHVSANTEKKTKLMVENTLQKIKNKRHTSFLLAHIGIIAGLIVGIVLSSFSKLNWEEEISLGILVYVIMLFVAEFISIKAFSTVKGLADREDVTELYNENILSKINKEKNKIISTISAIVSFPVCILLVMSITSAIAQNTTPSANELVVVNYSPIGFFAIIIEVVAYFLIYILLEKKTNKKKL